MTSRHAIESGDAVQLPCNTIHAVHHIEVVGEGLRSAYYDKHHAFAGLRP